MMDRSVVDQEVALLRKHLRVERYDRRRVQLDVIEDDSVVLALVVSERVVVRCRLIETGDEALWRLTRYDAFMASRDVKPGELVSGADAMLRSGSVRR